MCKDVALKEAIRFEEEGRRFFNKSFFFHNGATHSKDASCEIIRSHRRRMYLLSTSRISFSVISV